MERLTERDKNGFVISGIETNAVNGCYDIWDYDRLEKALDRLAAIEDILGEQYDLDRLRELTQADKEGRCAVLPCKPGDRILIDGRKAIIVEFFGFETERYFRAQFYDNMQYIDIPFEEIGKTVFIAHEEAEAALRREQK